MATQVELILLGGLQSLVLSVIGLLLKPVRTFPATTPYSVRVPVADGCITVVLEYLCHTTLLSR